MTLQYAKNTPVVEEILEKLTELSLAHKKEITAESQTPILIDGAQKISGREEILEHLAQVQSELKYWHSCAWKP